MKVERVHKGLNWCSQNLGIAKKQKKMDRHKRRTKKLPSRHDGPCSWDKATLQVHKCAQASLSPDPVNIVNLLFVNIWKYCKFVICNLIFYCYTFAILLSCPFSKEEMSDGRYLRDFCCHSSFNQVCTDAEKNWRSSRWNEKLCFALLALLCFVLPKKPNTSSSCLLRVFHFFFHGLQGIGLWHPIVAFKV